MKRDRTISFGGFSAALLVLMVHYSSGNSPVIICRGMCDASAVVPFGQYFIVANDEDNALRVFPRAQGGLPLHTFELSSFLRVDPKSPEADFEGAAPIGDRVYWITSHARNKNGKERPSRRRFFATTISASNGVPIIQPVGLPYAGLLSNLVNDDRLSRFKLASAARRAPKSKNALNIEALCSTPEGHLLLGFRNPIPNGNALLVPLLNPDQLIAGKPAQFGEPILLDLGGLGIRSLARTGSRYFIIAGSFDDQHQPLLYEWRGGTDKPCSMQRAELKGLNPEAIECFTENAVERLLVVSDDGALKIGGHECKELLDPNLKYFRATTLDL